MNITRTATAASMAALLALTVGCSSSPSRQEAVTVAPVTMSPSQYDVVQFGQVRSIDMVERAGGNSHVGAVVGAVVGGVVGNTIGSGTGRALATGAGAVGGALAGNKIEESRRSGNAVYRVEVQFDGGRTQAFDFTDLNGLRVGDRVRLENNQLQRY